MTPNKPTTLRESFKKRFKDSNLDFHYDGDLNQVFEWFDSHNTELVGKMEEKALYIRHNGAVNLDIGALVRLEDIKSIINQEK